MKAWGYLVGAVCCLGFAWDIYTAPEPNEPLETEETAPLVGAHFVVTTGYTDPFDDSVHVFPLNFECHTPSKVTSFKDLDTRTVRAVVCDVNGEPNAAIMEWAGEDHGTDLWVVDFELDRVEVQALDRRLSPPRNDNLSKIIIESEAGVLVRAHAFVYGPKVTGEPGVREFRNLNRNAIPMPTQLKIFLIKSPSVTQKMIHSYFVGNEAGLKGETQDA